MLLSIDLSEDGMRLSPRTPGLQIGRNLSASFFAMSCSCHFAVRVNFDLYGPHSLARARSTFKRGKQACDEDWLFY